jgi:dihydroorotate dehydrogenase (fumarate)
MIDLSTTYMGLALSNPLVPSASPQTRSLDTARQLEDAGAAAIVMHSLFEEELSHQEESMDRFLIHQDIGHAEADSFLPFHPEYKHGLDQYLEQLQALKQALDIPVIASLNGISLHGWLKHGKELEQAGADALELNVYYVAADPNQSAADVEKRYLDILRELRRHVTLPIAMKLSPQFSALPHFVSQLEKAGADAVSLFNRFYQPDIELESGSIIPHLQLSRPAEALLAIRWIAILYGRVSLSLAATGGIHNASDAAKLLLSGADIIHLCSVLLKNGPQYLAEIKRGLEEWLERSEYDSVSDLKGRLSQSHVDDPSAFEHANYVWVLDSYTPARGVQR